MAIRRYFEKMLIWSRSKKDELIYSVSLLLIASGIFLGATLINVEIGAALLLSGIVILGLGIIWNKE